MYRGIILTGPSAVGKSSIVAGLDFKKIGIEKTVTTTTRQIREGETDGKDYYFISRDRFQLMISGGLMFEHDEHYGNLYGIHNGELDRIDSIGRLPLFVVDVNGAKTLKAKLQKSYSIMIAPPSLDILSERISSSRASESSKSLLLRLQKAKEELDYSEKCDKIVVNEFLEVAIDETSRAIKQAIKEIKA